MTEDKKATPVRLVGELRERMEAEKKRTGASFQWLIERALEGYLPPLPSKGQKKRKTA